MYKRTVQKGIVALIGVAMLFSCQNDLQTIDTLTRVDEGPLESAFNVEIIYSDEGFVRMILHAEQMDRFAGEEPYLELPKGLHVVFYDTLMNETSSMTARYAISYEDTEIIEARNDVVVINELGEKLNAEQLIWDQRQGIIYSDKFVKVTTDEEVMYGEGFRADERFNTWSFERPRGTFSIDVSGTPRDTLPEPQPATSISRSDVPTARTQ